MTVELSEETQRILRVLQTYVYRLRSKQNVSGSVPAEWADDVMYLCQEAKDAIKEDWKVKPEVVTT